MEKVAEPYSRFKNVGMGPGLQLSFGPAKARLVDKLKRRRNLVGTKFHKRLVYLRDFLVIGQNTRQKHK